MFERKTLPIRNFAFKADDGADGGTFEGYGSVFGNVDSGGDVILKGAFADAIPDFLSRGFVPVGHDWMGLPIATIDEAKEDDDGLFFKAAFHTTQAAQDARTVMRERMERGKFVGLSIGYLPDYDDGVEFRDDGVRVLSKIKELAEISFVTVPMNREAGVAAVKTAAGAPPFSERAARVLADVEDFIEHAKAHAAMRDEFKEGRALSAANRTRLSGISGQMREAATSLDTILADTDPDREKQTAADYNRRRLLMHDLDLLLADAI